MAIETAHLRLLACQPEHQFGLIEGTGRFEERSGLRADDGLRDFLAADDNSPEWLARVRASPEADPWAHGSFAVRREGDEALGVVGFKGPPDADGAVESLRHRARPPGAGVRDGGGLCPPRVHIRRPSRTPRPGPDASTRVLTKCGFEFLGEVAGPAGGLVWRWQRDRPATA